MLDYSFFPPTQFPLFTSLHDWGSSELYELYDIHISFMTGTSLFLELRCFICAL